MYSKYNIVSIMSFIGFDRSSFRKVSFFLIFLGGVLVVRGGDVQKWINKCTDGENSHSTDREASGMYDHFKLMQECKQEQYEPT